MRGTAETLPEAEVHVWHLDSHRTFSPELLAAYEALLTPEELARRNRFAFPKGRLQYLLTRTLVRTVLSTYTDEVRPEQWRFGANAHGRPHLVTPHPVAGLSFNLSNTEGRVVCAVGRSGEVGVDVERVDRERSLLELADRFFAPAESTALRALPPEAHAARFFEYWTLKEAYIKACGKGLAIPLDHFEFELTGADPVHVRFTDALKDRPADWQFALRRLSPELQLAVALRRGSAPDRKVCLRELKPGGT